MEEHLDSLARQVSQELERIDRRLVLAESCTCGLIAATLGLVPGISRYLCGSAVVYREQTKIDWLDVKAHTLKAFTAVSKQASDEITRGVLAETAEADISLGITGHFGPNAPEGLDGAVFLSVWARDTDPPAQTREIEAAKKLLKLTSRAERQTEAAAEALRFLHGVLSAWST